jgi:hypothetical protein
MFKTFVSKSSVWCCLLLSHHTLLEGTAHKQGARLQIADVTQQRAYE